MADRTPLSLRWREFVAQGFAAVEDIVYLGLGLLLAITAGALLFASIKNLVTVLVQRSLAGQAVAVLDQILLILLVIELLYTVQVSFREHSLLAEPFIVVALIAVIRRVLILTAEVPKLPEAGEAPFRHAMLELGLLTVMIVVLVGSLIAMQKAGERSATQTGTIAPERQRFPRVPTGLRCLQTYSHCRLCDECGKSVGSFRRTNDPQ